MSDVAPKRVSTFYARKDRLESFAYELYWQAVAVDPDWPDYDETIMYDSDQHENQGFAAGLRYASTELLKLIDRGKVCTKCDNRIGDPQLPDDEGERCRGCADPS